MARPIRSALLAAAIAVSLLVTPTASANTFEVGCASETSGGWSVTSEPTLTGSTGSAFSTSMVFTNSNPATLELSADPFGGITATQSGNQLNFSGTPTAGSFTVSIRAATSCAYYYTRTFTFSAPADVPTCTNSTSGGFVVTTEPIRTGTGGVAFSTSMVFTNSNPVALTLSAAAFGGVTATQSGNRLDFSGTPTAGSYTVNIRAATSCALTYSRTFTFGEPLTVGKPTLAGTLTAGATLTCKATTFSSTPGRIRIYFTSAGVEIPDDAGALVTSVDVLSNPGTASMVVTEQYDGAAIGCTVAATAGAQTATASDSYGVLNIPLTVGAPTLAGTLNVGNEITCSSSTFSRTPTQLRIYFTKDGIEIPDDAGDAINPVNSSNSSGTARMTLSSAYYDGRIGCTVYAKAGIRENTATAAWGVFYSPSEFHFVLQFSEDEMRDGNAGNFTDADKQKQYADGFVGGHFVLGGNNIDHFQYTIVPNTGTEPTSTKDPSEQAVTKTPVSKDRVELQLPATSPGEYFIVARGTAERPGLQFLPIKIDKPVVSVADAKLQTGDSGATSLNGDGKYLPPAVTQLLENLAQGKEPLAPIANPDGIGTVTPLLVQQQQATAAAIATGPFTGTLTQVTAEVALKAITKDSDVAVQTKTLYQAFRKTFPQGIRIQFNAMSSTLTPASVRNLRKLATLPIKQIRITGYVQKSADKANDTSLSLARAKSVSTALVQAKLKPSIISVRAGGVGGKSISNRSVIINMK